MVVAGRGARAQQEAQAPADANRVGSYLSYTWIGDARNGWDLGADLDLGAIVPGRARFMVGANYLEAEIDRVGPTGVPLGGSFHDVSVTADVRVTLVRAGAWQPFAGAGVGLHVLGNHITGDARVRDRYDGTALGAQLFGGTEVDLTDDRRWSGYLELRRIAVRTVGRTTVRLGAFVRL